MRAYFVYAIALAGVYPITAQSLPARGAKTFSQIPFAFERNAGQFAGSHADWAVRRDGYQILIGSGGARIRPFAPGGSDEIRMLFSNGGGAAKSEALEPLPGRINYLIGADPHRWVRDVETFRRVLYRGVYDGVDVSWYGSEGRLEYDFLVHPGADTSRIALRIEGARKLAVEPNGDLRIETSDGPLTLQVPAVYQDGAGGARQRVEGHYVLRAGNEVGFTLAGYDKSRALVIDPTLLYAAWFNAQNLFVTSMARDPQGNIYVGGEASSLPGLNPLQGSITMLGPFVAKFDPTGTTMLYATYVSGSSGDNLSGLAADATGNVVVTGQARSADFPVVNAVQQTCNPNSANQPCGYVFRLNASGDALIYSTYVVNSGGNGVAVDATGNAYVALTASIQKYAPNGALLKSTTGVHGNAITFDQQGAAYIAGTSPPPFTNVPGAHSGSGSGSAFAAKLTPDLQTVTWAALLGGNGAVTPHAIARDPTSGVLYFAGETTATDLSATAGAIQVAKHGLSDGFIASVSADGSAFGFVTYLGGSADDQIYAMTLDGAGNIVVAGDTLSPDFPVAHAVQPAIGGNTATLFATTDYGQTWTAEGNGLPSSWGGETLSTNPAVMVAATLSGLFRSTDSGASWTPVGAAGSYAGWVPGISRSLVNPELLYALSSTSYLSRSTDGGATWSVPQYIYNAYSIVASPVDEKTVVVIGWDGTVYTSTDGGATFASSSRRLGSSGGAPVASPDGSMYLPVPGGLYNGINAGIIKSLDNGKTWTPLAGSPNWGGVNAPPISVCTANPSVLYFANWSYLFRSEDAGATWAMLNYAYNVAGSASSCQVVYALGSPFGLQVSTDWGATWSPASGDLTKTIFNALAVDPANPAHAWVAPNIYTDGFVAKISNDGKTLPWSTFYGGSLGEDIRGVIVDNAGTAWIGGSTISSDLPGLTGVQPSSSWNSVLLLAEISDATAACSWQLDPASADPPATGGIVNFGVTAPSGCAWTATPSDTWISTAHSPGGTASGSVGAKVFANNTGATRTGTIAIGDQTFTISQAPTTCQYSLNPTFVYLPPAGGQTTVSVTAPDGCAWSVVPNGLTIVSGGTGSGNGSVTLSAPANTGLSAVTYTPVVATVSFPVTVSENCTYSLSPLSAAGGSAELLIGVTPSLTTCRWYASTDAPWLPIYGSPVSGAYPQGLDMFLPANHTGAQRTANIFIGPQTFTVTQAADTAAQYTLSVLAQPPAGGTVSGGGVYDSGQYVYLNAAANLGWTFTGWSGMSGLTGASPSFAITGNTTVTANFTTPTALSFIPITPCRAVDTRNGTGPLAGPSITGGASRDFAFFSSNCGIPSTAAAYSLNATVVPHGALGYLTLWPTGQPRPIVSTLNSLDGRIKANAAIVPAGANGAVSAYATDATDLILDIDGYFVPAGNSSGLAFYPLTPCRIADTRAAAAPALTASQNRTFAIAGNCAVPSSAQAYSLNFTAVPTATLGYLTVWPTGQQKPVVSTLNALTGAITANAAIVPAGSGGDLNVYATDAADLIIDVNGYFAPAGAGGLSLYNLIPCRVVDTRNSAASPIAAQLDVNVLASGCGAPSTAQAYVLNATAIPPAPLGYISLWPKGQTQPVVSTLNAFDGAITSNMAIAPTSNGSVSAFPSSATHLILDIAGYFAP